MFQTRMIRRVVLVSAACCVAGLFSNSAETVHAAQLVNIANNAPVIGGTGDIYGGLYNVASTFGTSNVTNGQNATPNNNIGSPITEPGQDGSYWLGSGSTGYFVLNLGSPQSIAGFELFNTRNASYDDSGTGRYTITGSNSLVNLGGTLGENLASPVLLASGSLTNQTYVSGPGAPGSTPLVPNEIVSQNHTAFQYIRFDALSIGAAVDKTFGAARVGLNEFRAFATPEPSSFILCGLGAVGLFIAARRRRKA